MTPAPVTGGRAWAGAALVALAVLSGLWTLGTLVAPGGWLRTTAVLVVLVLAVTASVRTVGRSPAAPTAWGAATAVVALAVLYGGPGTGPTLPMPTIETLRRLWRLAEAGAAAVAEGHIPVAPTRGLELLVVAGVVVVALLVDLLALGMGRGGLAGLPLAALWSVAVVFERSFSGASLLLGGTTFLLLLALTRPARPAESTGRRDVPLAVAAAAGVTVLAVVAAPLAAAAPFWGSVRLPTTWGAGQGQGPVSLSLDLDMRASLGPRSDRALLTYTTDAESLGPLRLYTLTEFDGAEWQRDTTPVDLRESDGLLWPDADSPTPVDGAGVATVSVRVGDLDQDRLPVPIEPRTVRAEGDWRYDAERDEVLSPRGSTRGMRYELTVTPRDLSQEALRADAVGPVDEASPYLRLPESPYEADIRRVAQEITADAPTAYDRAVALQTWFRDVTRFSYDTEVPEGDTEDAVWDFLTHRRGYCVQYATAMTIMARHLGIPARMGVGFLPGRLTSAAGGEYVVTGRLAHTWPELYFAGAGWVRFEPTPAAQTGAPPLYADPLVTEPASPEEERPTAAATPVAPLDPGATTDQEQATSAEASIGTGSAPVMSLVGAGVLVAAGVLAALVLPRRRRREAAPLAPETAWAALRGRLEAVGVRWSDSTTPRRAAAVVRERYGTNLDVDATLSLERLVRALENERYSPAPGEWSPQDLNQWVDDVVRPLEPRPEPVPSR